MRHRASLVAQYGKDSDCSSFAKVALILEGIGESNGAMNGGAIIVDRSEGLLNSDRASMFFSVLWVFRSKSSISRNFSAPKTTMVM